jgi:8-amino-7-oxononanoate synthase
VTSSDLFFKRIKSSLVSLESKKHIRSLEICDVVGKHITIENRKLLSFASNDYLGMSQDVRLKDCAKKVIDSHGVGSGSSRYISGNHPFYLSLESKIATFKDADDCLVFGSGYLANIGILQSLITDDDLIILDRNCHNSLFSGAKLTRATVKVFHHNDTDHLAKVLDKYKSHFTNCMVITEGVFSMDGDTAPLKNISDLCINYDALMLIDDAHALGVINDGCGSKISQTDNKNIIVSGTLSKALGAYGGYICAHQSIIDLIKQKAHSLIYSTSLPPAIIASASAAIDLIKNNPSLAGSLLERATLFSKLMNLKQEPQSAIIPIIVQSERKAINLARLMQESGFYVPCIRPPTVAKKSSRLRFSFSTLHNEEEIVRCAQSLKSYL